MDCSRAMPSISAVRANDAMVALAGGPVSSLLRTSKPANSSLGDSDGSVSDVPLVWVISITRSQCMRSRA